MRNISFSSFVGAAASFFLISPLSLSATELVLGDPSAPAGQTFSFPVSQHAINHWASHFYVGALASGAGKNFALTRVVRKAGAYRDFEPLAPEMVFVNEDSVINDKVGQVPNPLFDAGIAYLTLLEKSLESRRDGFELPVVVTTNEQTTIYVIDMIAREIIVECKDDGTGTERKTETERAGVTSLVSASNIKDSQGNTTSQVLGLAAGRPSFTKIVEEYDPTTCRNEKRAVVAIRQEIFAPVRNHANTAFGDPGSGVAVFMYGDRETALDDGQKVSRHSLEQIGNAAPLTRNDSIVKIVNDLALITDVISVYWFENLQRLYIGLQITNGNGGAAGGKALVLGRVLENGGLELDTVVPDTVFNPGAMDEIVGSISPNAQTSMNAIQGMVTSTKLFYLIVQGGNGSPAQTSRSVYALPLVNTGAATSTQGMIAAKNQIPKNFFGCTAGVETFSSRGLLIPATTHNEMPQATDRASLVGAGPVAAGAITDMFVRNDTVFAVIGSALSGQQPGIFSSSALFDVTGKINGWTSWRRVAGTTDSVFGAALDYIEGNFILMTGPNSRSLTTVLRTVWGTGSPTGLADLGAGISAAFPVECGGVMGVNDLPPALPGIQNISLLIVTGFGKVALVETGVVTGGVLVPNAGDFSSGLQQYTNGMIDVTLPGSDNSRVVEISGGVLSRLGPIVSGAVGSAGGTSRLFVGGTCGLAVLVDAAGNGWNTAAGLGPNFVGLTQGMTFKYLDDYRMVRKLVADGQYLYVLTDTRLDRIDLLATNFATGVLSRVTLAVPGDIVGVSEHGTFFDLIISEKLGLIATSAGIARNGSGTSIKDPTVTGAQSLQWVPVFVPECGLNPVVQLVPFSVSNIPQDVSSMGGGIMYSLCADRGFHSASINRFVIEDTQVGPVTDTTVRAFSDFFIKGALSHFFRYKAFREGFNIINGIFFDSVDRRGCRELPIFELLNAKDIRRVTIDFTGFSDISYYALTSASGSVLVAGDFGFRFNE